MITPSFWNEEPLAAEFSPLLPHDLKERIATEGLSFTVHGIRDVAKTQYGAAWMLDIELEGERWTLALGRTSQRDAQLKRMTAYIDTQGPVACGLRTIDGAKGYGWLLVPPPDGTPAPQ